MATIVAIYIRSGSVGSEKKKKWESYIMRAVGK